MHFFQINLYFNFGTLVLQTTEAVIFKMLPILWMRHYDN